MEKSIVTLKQFSRKFPNARNKSKETAKEFLPLQPSQNLAAIVAALMTDGHIDWYTKDNRPRTRKIILYSSNKGECEWFLNLIKKLFGAEGKLQAYIPKSGYFKKQPYKATVHNATIAKALILAGVPAGNKAEKEFLIPEWITNGNKEIKRHFLRAFFTFEGSKPKGHYRPCSFQIALNIVKNEKYSNNALRFLSQIREMMACFNIETSKAWHYSKCIGLKTGNGMFRFSIMKQSSILNFYREIGYFNEEKQEALEGAIRQIAKFGRIKNGSVCELINKVKNSLGSDNALAKELSKHTERNYTKRQIEHYRRKESALPLELLSALIKISGENEILKTIPENICFLQKIDSSVPLPL